MMALSTRGAVKLFPWGLTQLFVVLQASQELPIQFAVNASLPRSVSNPALSRPTISCLKLQRENSLFGSLPIPALACHNLRLSKIKMLNRPGLRMGDR